MVHPRLANHVAALTVLTLVGLGGYALDRQVGSVATGPLVSVATGGDPERASASPDESATIEVTSRANPAGEIRLTLAASTTGPSGSCPQGEYQRQVETYLAKLGGFGKVTVDGRQSAADCAAIKRFQQRYDIRPPAGRAGPITFDVSRRLASTDTTKCRTGTGITFCVDLTHQTVWAMKGRSVVMAPTVTRTGMPGYRTPSGTYKVNFRNTREWSDPYEVWLPYWQRFYRGMGFHQTTTYIHNKSIGSHGCVNLLPNDARRMWELGRVGTRVHLFGRRPGT